MKTIQLLEKYKEILLHVGLTGEYKPGINIIKVLKKSKCHECKRLAEELEVIESELASLKDEGEKEGTMTDSKENYPREFVEWLVRGYHIEFRKWDACKIYEYFKSQFKPIEGEEVVQKSELAQYPKINPSDQTTVEEKLFILDLLKMNKSVKVDGLRYYPENVVINIIKQVIIHK